MLNQRAICRAFKAFFRTHIKIPANNRRLLFAECKKCKNLKSLTED